MKPLQHEIIRASAGTGKTYQLTLRYLRLLVETRTPERIIALTFTRKAAGEFFEKIFHRLAEAAETEDAARRLSSELGVAVDAGACLGHLRLLLDRLHRLQLGTYDSFFARIVRTFPLELGLAGAPRLLDDNASKEAVRAAQSALARRRESDPLLLEFWHAFKRATMGREEKRLTTLLDTFIEDAHELYLESPEPERWGDAAQLWPDGFPWAEADYEPEAEAAALRAHFEKASFTPAQRRQWEQFLEALASWHPPLPAPKRVLDIAAKLLAVYDRLPTGQAFITVQKKLELDSAAGEQLQRLARFCVASVLQPRLEATRGLHRVLALFEEIYDAEIRRPGGVTIADLTRLLGGVRGLSDPALRATIDYRLDGAYDHWLLDEFQDTSHGQWRVLRDLVDEVLQDAEGRRSFFAVGDPKQCLYLWRNSDDRLFDRLQARYGGGLASRTLARSYRSAPPVLEAVNAIFGCSEKWPEWIPAGLVRRWRSLWVRHESAPKLASGTGFAALLHAPEEDEEGLDTLVDLLASIRPIEKGLTAAVLVRTNDDARAVVEYLRAHDGPPCSLASEHRPGTDNAVAAGLRSLLTIAAHPGDTAAWEHLRLTPPGAALSEQHGSAPALCRALLSTLARGGFTALVEDWRSRCLPHLAPDDDFNRERLLHCRALAIEADAASERDPDRFLRQLEALTLREADTPGAVSVLTVHKAKGLDWDVVFVVGLGNRKITQRRRDLAVQRDADGDVEWILDLPQADLLTADPVLSRHIEQAEEDAGFESLCVLYVALTRARRSLYMISHDTAGSKASSFPRFLNETLGTPDREAPSPEKPYTCVWSAGDPNWHTPPTPKTPNAQSEVPKQRMPTSDTSRSKEPQLLPATEWSRRPRLTALHPSAVETDGTTPRLHHLDANPEAGEAFGRAMHALLARIEWWPAEAASATALWNELALVTPPILLGSLRRLLEAPDTCAYFQPPPPEKGLQATVWREQAFEVVSGGRWISGRFDRVVLLRDAEGRLVRALLIDFKTDRLTKKEELSEAASRHAAQCRLYREALSQLLGLPTTAIASHLLFTSLPAAHHVRT